MQLLVSTKFAMLSIQMFKIIALVDESVVCYSIPRNPICSQKYAANFCRANKKSEWNCTIDKLVHP